MQRHSVVDGAAVRRHTDGEVSATIDERHHDHDTSYETGTTCDVTKGRPGLPKAQNQYGKRPGDEDWSGEDD